MCDAPTKPTQPANRKNGRVISLFAVMSMSFALLIWFKLRMVTGVPRTAYADPDPPQAQGLSQPLANPKPQPTQQPKPQPAQTEPSKVPPAPEVVAPSPDAVAGQGH